MKKWAIVLLILISAASLTGCAHKPTDPEELAIYEANNDPWEPMNRGIFAFNQVMDEYVLIPVAKTYRFITPQFLRTGIYNFSLNIRQPVYMINALLQGEGKQAGQIGERFLTNTFLGFLGTVDVAGDMKMPAPSLDFGQTLGVWGVGSGPYFIIPLLGPSSVRDAFGYGTDLVINPLNLATQKIWPGIIYSRYAIESIDARDRAAGFLKNIKESSTDFYATMRTMYQQNRVEKIARNKSVKTNGDADAVKKAYEFDFNIEEE